jgi:IrrE N-terminal-like domain
VTAQRAEIRRQAQAIAVHLEEADPGVLARLCENPLGELATWPGLQVRRVADIHAGDGCSVAGSYRSDTKPPTLCVAWSASSGRRQFTILHELAHHVQRNNAELAAVLMMSADPDGLEEAACNLFAAQTLLPDAIVDRYIGASGPSAAEVAGLHSGSQASRAACCVRSAERLRGPGAVALLDYEGLVSFAYPVGGFIPPARKSDQSGTPLISAALRSGGRARTETFVQYRTGSTSDTVYGDCADADGWLVAVLAAERAPWLAFSPPRPGTGSMRSNWWTCETCGDTFPASERCLMCGHPKCPQAGHCACTTDREITCTRCYMAKHKSQFEARGTVCRECRG